MLDKIERYGELRASAIGEAECGSPATADRIEAEAAALLQEITAWHQQQQELIGPLTAAEWAQFRLHDDDERDLLTCCASTSELRTAIMTLFRMGGGKEWAGLLASEWYTVMDSHPDMSPHPLLTKLFDFYLAGRPRPSADDGQIAEMMAADPGFAEQLLDAAPSLWDMRDPAAVRTALGRLAIKLYATPADLRATYIGRISEMTLLAPDQVKLVFDAFRGSVNLPITDHCERTS